MYLTSCLILKPGGFTGSAGTPNFLQSLDDYDTQVQWNESQVGALQSATIRNRIAYTNVMDIQAGNWVAFGCYGGTTGALSAGATSLTVNNCARTVNGVTVQDLIASDSLLVTDGVNAEIFKAASVSYSGSTATVALGAAQSQNTTALLNSYPSGAKVLQLKWQGLITGRKRTTDLSNIFQVNVSGMMWRYTKVLGDFDLSAQDCATSIYRICSMYSAQVPEIIVNSANFASANNIVYSGTAKHAPVATFLQDILKTESGGAVPTTPNEATYWAIWVDELRQVHHQQITTQATGSPTYSLGLINGGPNLYLNSDTLSSATLTGMSLGTGGPSGATDAEYTGTGSATTANKVISQQFTASVGQALRFSAYIDPSNIYQSSGGPVLNPSDKSAHVSLDSADLIATWDGLGGWAGIRGIEPGASGKWYWEVLVDAVSSGLIIGVGNASASTASWVGSDANGWAYSNDGRKYHSGAASYGASFTVGDVIGFALDMNAGTLTCYKNGTSQGQAFTGISGTVFPMLSGSGSAQATARFDASTFTYNPPSGFSPLPKAFIQLADTSGNILSRYPLSSSDTTAKRYATPAVTVAVTTVVASVQLTQGAKVSSNQKFKVSQPMLTARSESGDFDYTNYQPWRPTNTYGDALGPVQPQDMDMSRLLNCVLVEGGKDSAGNVIDIVLTVKPSYLQWGYYQGYLSNPNITDKGALATWAAGQVGVLAWPQQTGKLDLITASGRLSSRDLLQITGFPDGSTLVTNPTSIQYTADMKAAKVTGSASITQQQPNELSIMREISNEKSIRNREVGNGTNVAQSYLVSGCEVSTSGLNWSTTAGTVVYNGTTYSIPAQSGTLAANDVIRLGVQVAGSAPSGYTLPCVDPMPNFLPGTGMQRLNAHEWYELQTPGSGSYLSLVKQTDFQGVYLATLSADSSAITVTQRTTPFGGIGNSNLKPPTAGTPSAALNSSGVVAEGVASAYYSFDASVSGMTFDDTIRSIDASYSIAGDGNWHPWVPCQYTPSTGSVSGTIHGLAAGQDYDIALQPRGVNGAALGSPLILGASPSVSASAIAAAINNTNLIPDSDFRWPGHWHPIASTSTYWNDLFWIDLTWSGF